MSEEQMDAARKQVEEWNAAHDVAVLVRVTGKERAFITTTTSLAWVLHGPSGVGARPVLQVRGMTGWVALECVTPEEAPWREEPRVLRLDRIFTLADALHECRRAGYTEARLDWGSTTTVSLAEAALLLGEGKLGRDVQVDFLPGGELWVHMPALPSPGLLLRQPATTT